MSCTWRWRVSTSGRAKNNTAKTKGICERFQKTVLNEFYRVLFRKKVYHGLEELEAYLDAWIEE